MQALTGLSGLSAFRSAAGGGGGATVTDSFNRTNNAGSLGTADSGQIWQANLGTWGISGNQAYCSADGGAFVDVATLPAAADGTLQVALPNPAGGSGGSAWVVCRCAAGANRFLYVACSGGGDPFRLASYDEGLMTTLGTGSLPTANPNDVVKVVLAGASVKVYVNDVLDISVTSTFNQTETRVGIGTDYGVDGQARFDNISFTP